MPTYRNDGNSTYIIDNQKVQPGFTVETDYLLTDDGNPWTKTKDTPYYNPVTAVHDTIASSGAGDPKTVDLSADTQHLELYNNSSANITILLNAVANTPGYPVPATSVRTLENVKGYVDSLVLQFDAAAASGEVILTEKGE